MSELSYRTFSHSKRYGLELMSMRVREEIVHRCDHYFSYVRLWDEVYGLLDEVALELHFCLGPETPGNYGVIL